MQSIDFYNLGSAFVDNHAVDSYQCIAVPSVAPKGFVAFKINGVDPFFNEDAVANIHIDAVDASRMAVVDVILYYCRL